MREYRAEDIVVYGMSLGGYEAYFKSFRGFSHATLVQWFDTDQGLILQRWSADWSPTKMWSLTSAVIITFVFWVHALALASHRLQVVQTRTYKMSSTIAVTLTVKCQNMTPNTGLVYIYVNINKLVAA